MLFKFSKALLFLSTIFYNFFSNSHRNESGLFSRICERMIKCTYTTIFTTDLLQVGSSVSHILSKSAYKHNTTKSMKYGKWDGPGKQHCFSSIKWVFYTQHTCGRPVHFYLHNGCCWRSKSCRISVASNCKYLPDVSRNSISAIPLEILDPE